MWHIPAYYGAGQTWISKSIAVDFWGAQKNQVLDGKVFIAKVQEEWKRATCLSIDFFDDAAAAESYMTRRVVKMTYTSKCSDVQEIIQQIEIEKQKN